jgi:integrase
LLLCSLLLLLSSLLLLLYWSGLRVSELVGLHLPDVDTAAQLVTVRHGKGGKDRIIPCVPEIRRELLAYLMARPAWSGPEIFLSNDGYGGARGALTAEGVRQMLRRRCRLTHLRHMNPHAFRHGFAMAMLNSGMQMSAVSDVMGHSSEQMTASIYARWLTAGLSREYHQARARLEATHNE